MPSWHKSVQTAAHCKVVRLASFKPPLKVPCPLFSTFVPLALVSSERLVLALLQLEALQDASLTLQLPLATAQHCHIRQCVTHLPCRPPRDLIHRFVNGNAVMASKRLYGKSCFGALSFKPECKGTERKSQCLASGWSRIKRGLRGALVVGEERAGEGSKGRLKETACSLDLSGNE